MLNGLTRKGFAVKLTHNYRKDYEITCNNFKGFCNSYDQKSGFCTQKPVILLVVISKPQKSPLVFYEKISDRFYILYA